MRRVLFVITRAFVILLILNILTNNYFSYNFINIFVILTRNYCNLYHLIIIKNPGTGFFIQ